MSLPSRFYEKIYNFTKEEKEEEKDYWGHKCTDQDFLGMKEVGKKAIFGAEVKPISHYQSKVEEANWKDPKFRPIPHQMKEKSNLLGKRYYGDTYLSEGPKDMSKNEGDFVSGVGAGKDMYFVNGYGTGVYY